MTKQAFWNVFSTKWKEKWMERKKWQIEERKAFAKKVTSGVILDLACGGGRDKVFFEEEGLEYAGLDFSKQMMKGEQGNFICGNAISLPFIEESFDGIWCCSLVKHLGRKEIKNLIREICRVTKVKGYVWICFDEGKGVVQEERWGVKIPLTLCTEAEILSYFAGRFKVVKVQKVKKWRNFISVLAQKVK
jgi:ubiquinone/menaquinone biosynthesis C-methylase UbiE